MSKLKKSAPKKNVRIADRKTIDVVTVKGDTGAYGTKSFSFKGLSAVQQMKRRNGAYRFFSIHS